MSNMTPKLKELIGRAETWPEEAQDELLQLAEFIEHELSGEPYHASTDELRAIDEADRETRLRNDKR